MTTKFIRGDGVEFECEVGSEAFKLMEKDGAFTRIFPEEEAAAQLAEVSDAESVRDAGDAETADKKKKVSGKNA